jgi:acyl-homoserine-lactone acylase
MRNLGDAAVFSTAWNENDPLNTPDGFTDPAAMATLLDATASELKARHGRLDISWGEVNRIEYNGISLPANGASESLGVFRVASARPGKEKTQVVRSGDSWVGIIEFADIPRARVLLSYGNSSQPGSPHFGDQLHLFSEQKLREAWRTPEQLSGHISRTEVLRDGSFVPREDPTH